MSAQAALVVYPESVQSSIGLPGSIDPGLLVNTMSFDYGTTTDEYTDEDNVPDIIVISNPKVEISVNAVVKNRNSTLLQSGSGCTKIPISSLPFNSILWTQGNNNMLSSGAYAIFMQPKRQSEKAKPDTIDFVLRMHGYKPATRFPV